MHTPAELGALLGLSVDPEDFTLSLCASENVRKSSNINFRGLDSAYSAHLPTFWAELASLFLPQLIQAFIHHPNHAEPTSDNRSDFLNFTGTLQETISMRGAFVHLFRTRPDEVFALWFKNLEVISLFSFDDVMQRPGRDEVHAAQTDTLLDLLLIIWMKVHSYLLLLVEDHYTLPTLDPATRLRLQSLLPAVSSNQDRWTRDCPRLAEALQDFRVFLYLDEVAFKASLRLFWMEEDEDVYLQWWDCEKPHDDEGDEDDDCFEGTEEMRACGRCYSVRYCSRRHQRMHWKTHKLVCFGPQW